ncbi:MAG TPA: energy transducer TonB [Pyrinomonadaceae bacterium]
MSIAINIRWAFLLVVALTCALSVGSSAQEQGMARARVAVLDFGATPEGRRTAERVASSLARDERLSIMDRDLSRAASQGAGYAGSLNMTLEEARNLGAVIDCDFFVTGDAQTLRRSPSVGPIYYEAYVAVFIVSARTGRLIMWERPSFEAATPAEAERRLFAELDGGGMRQRYAAAIRRAQEDERNARALAQSHSTPVIEDAPAEEEAEAHGLRLPQPYRRQRPPYPEEAARIEAEATVDVEVEIGADGEVMRVDVVRWAGFGLDEATVQTVRQLHFRPAMRGRTPVPMRVLLRYNFRKPPKQ